MQNYEIFLNQQQHKTYETANSRQNRRFNRHIIVKKRAKVLTSGSGFIIFAAV